MGKFILCTGVQAKEPYHFRLTNTKLYSLEELGYYIYHNIYTISLEDFGEDFFNWVQYDLKREDLAGKWRSILEKSDDMKDIVVSILCATDYFSKLEVESMVKTIDCINGLSPIGKKKIKADNFLRYGDYENAAMEYQAILADDASEEFSAYELGNMLHNLAVAHIHQGAFEQAEKELKEAYGLNKKEESLKEYLFLLKLEKKDGQLESEIAAYSLLEEKAQEYMSELEDVFAEAETSKEYKRLLALPGMKADGKVGEYYYNIDSKIFQWKQKYKQGMEQR